MLLDYSCVSRRCSGILSRWRKDHSRKTQGNRFSLEPPEGTTAAPSHVRMLSLIHKKINLYFFF